MQSNGLLNFTPDHLSLSKPRTQTGISEGGVASLGYTSQVVHNEREHSDFLESRLFTESQNIRQIDRGILNYKPDVGNRTQQISTWRRQFESDCTSTDSETPDLHRPRFTIRPAESGDYRIRTSFPVISTWDAEEERKTHGISVENRNMVKATDQDSSSGIHVAPLHVHKSRSREFSNTKYKNRPATGGSDRSESLYYQAQMTPPATPNSSQEALVQQPQPVFSNFLRAFYPFHPNYTTTDNTVTLPLNEGDIVLVHSIHTNGWADGTLLLSGARGWLPTNYCNPYEPEWMRNLLNALLNFSDLFSSGVVATHEVIGNQEFMRGIIAGVRYLLEKTKCLTRESPIIQTNESLRRNRKALLSDLSALVRIAKRLGELAASRSPDDAEEVHQRVEEIILKAFRIVTRAVKFLDAFQELKAIEVANEQPAPASINLTLEQNSTNPLTPPADSTSFERPSASESSHLPTVSETPADKTRNNGSAMLGSSQYKRQSMAHGTNPTSARPNSILVNRHSNRLSVSHRLSLASPMLAAQREKLVSFRIDSTHEALLSHIGSFVGCLQQFQHSATLAHHVDQSLTSGRALLAAVEAVCAHDYQSAESIRRSKEAMKERFVNFMRAAQDILKPVSLDDEDIMMPNEHKRLMDAATSCVSAAGTCVTRTKSVFERIGDFEFEPASDGKLGIDEGAIDGTRVQGLSITVDITPSETSAGRRKLPPLTIETTEKPLPKVPMRYPNINAMPPPSVDAASSSRGAGRHSTTSSLSSTRSLLPPLPKSSGLFSSQEEYSPSELSSADSEFHPSFRAGSVTVSSVGSRSTAYLSSARDSETSMLSDASTRATTPDVGSYIPMHKPSISSSSFGGSHNADDNDDLETGLLTKTFAHELMYNKDGQITGGSLPALVERLTTHDSTPDATFVATFYLTFRLFVTPKALVAALVDRFDYIGEGVSTVAGPVRLRVYNIFKGWLETHWRGATDNEALPAIKRFAKEKLSVVIPAAGKRLLELTGKVSSTDGQLVPRLVSAIGKTNTSNSQYISPDTPMPSPVISKSQMQLLKSWKFGGNMPSLMDFEPLELARQLTLKDMKIFCSIMPEELLASEWMKKTGSNAVNVRAMSTLSTDLSNLVADTILQHEDAKKRAAVVKQWIKIASKCEELNNYDSLMAILCSLNSSTILRLRKTWDAVPQKRKEALKELQEIVQPTRNHAVLRQRLHDHVPPCLPFVGTYLTDLTFVDIGNAATKQLPGSDEDSGMSVINFDKHTRTAKLIGDLQRFQIPYRLVEIPDLQEWIQAQIVRVKSSDPTNVQQYYRKSLLLEPREASARPSPHDAQSGFPTLNAGYREKGNIFGWSHSSKPNAAPS